MGNGVCLWTNLSKSLPSQSLCSSGWKTITFIVVNGDSAMGKMRADWKWVTGSRCGGGSLD